jgi:hypothetical protein
MNPAVRRPLADLALAKVVAECQLWREGTKTMSELENISKMLRGAGQRRRLQRALNGLAEGALVGAILLVLALAAYKFLPVSFRIIPLAGGVAIACALAGALRRGWRRDTPAETARWVDDQRQLKERLSTALEVSGQNASADWKNLVLTDASRHAANIDVRQLGSFAFPRRARWAALVLALAAGLGFVPEYRTKAYRQQQQDAVVVQDVGRNLAELTRRELAQKPPTVPEVQKSMEEVAELGEKLGQHSLTKAEALKDLANVAEKIAKQEQRLGETPAYKKLEQAARQPGNSTRATPESIQKEMAALQKAMGDAADKAKQLDQLSRDLQKLQQQAAAMASNDGKAGEAARQKMAESLAELARQAQQAGASLENLDDAIQALQSNNVDQFIKDLDLASHDLEKLQDMAKAMQQLQQQMSKMGKDLAEQLKFGQAQAAVQTLEKMIDQLKSSGLSPEQMQQLLDELKNASQPAQEYGKVADHLQKAMAQCKSGDKSGGAQSLAAAQDELKKMLEQMQDNEGLQAAMEALERAQAAVASGQLWSQVQRNGGKCSSCQGAGCARCDGTGRCFGKGGRPGRGVGTWAEEDYGWTHFDQQDGNWDNSGIQRPDTDPKAPTERPTDLNPNLVPDKVKGKMSPGSSMPSITLKGVSIKGSSNIKFEEAATAAQQDAESALNQDRVPRAYQNAVRDYFDDLKK